MSTALPRALIAALAALALAAVVALAHEGAPHWSYKGQTGPMHWSSLEQEFSACGAGREQSPIDIRRTDAQRGNLPAIEFSYRPANLKLIDNGHTIEVIYPPGSFITAGGHRYELQQFHFHKPSEEAIDGRHADMVAHLVHKDDQGHLAFVAVLLTAGKVNPMVATLWNNLPTKKEAEVEVPGVQINAGDLLPADRGYYSFAGSLTTPPCSEGVELVRAGRILRTCPPARSAASAQLSDERAADVQPLNGRMVRVSD